MSSEQSVTQLWAEALHTLCKFGPDPFHAAGVRTAIGYAGELLDPTQNLLLRPDWEIDYSYACANALWLLSARRDTTMIGRYKVEEAFAEERNESVTARLDHQGDEHWKAARDEVLRKGYTQRDVTGSSQLKAMVHRLKSEGHAKDAILSVWRSSDLLYARCGIDREIPRVLTLQFLVRGKQLHLIANCRTNDIWKHMLLDIFAFTCMQVMIAHWLGVELGSYYHQVGALTLSEEHYKEWYKAGGHKIPAAAHEPLPGPVVWKPFSARRMTEAIQSALHWEAQIYKDREMYNRGQVSVDQIVGVLADDCGEDSLLADLALGCIYKWIPSDIILHAITSPLLQKGLQQC